MRQLIRTRDHLKKKANQTGSKYIFQAYQQVRSKVSCGIRKLRSDYYYKKIEESTGDLKTTWKILKEVINKDQKTAEINKINVDSETVIDKKTISEALNQHFVSIGERLAGGILDPVLTSSEYLLKTANFGSKFSFKTIQPKRVFATISKLINGKATRLNMIPNKILKCSKNVIFQSLVDIFNASIQSGIFPDDFKIAGVTQIFKEGEKGDVSNYRTISILCTVAIVFEKLLYNQLHQYLVQHNALCSNQWGFRSLHSAALALIDCTDNWKLNVDKGKFNSPFCLIL